jgi:hypothetical protein
MYLMFLVKKKYSNNITQCLCALYGLYLMFFIFESERVALKFSVCFWAMHLPVGAVETKNPYVLKNVGTLEQYGTIATFITLF